MEGFCANLERWKVQPNTNTMAVGGAVAKNPQRSRMRPWASWHVETHKLLGVLRTVSSGGHQAG